MSSFANTRPQDFEDEAPEAATAAPRWRRLVPWVALMAMLAVGVAALRPEQEAAQSVMTATAELRDLRVSVHTVGKLDAARSTIVSSPIRGDRGRIIWIIEEGTQVEKDDVLIRLDPTPFEEAIKKLDKDIRDQEAKIEEKKQDLEWERLQSSREIESAEYDAQAAELSLKKLDKGDGPLELARLESAALKTRQEADRKSGFADEMEMLAERKLANPVEVERVRSQADEAQQLYRFAQQQFENYRDYVLPSQLESSRAQVQRSKAQLEQARQGAEIRRRRGEMEVQRLEAELESLRRQLAETKQELTATALTAPIPGMVVLQEDYRDGQRRKPRVGDTVVQNRALVYLPDVTYMNVHTRVREVDLHQVREGAPAVVRVDAFPELELPGKVESVGVLAESSSSSSAAGGDTWFGVTLRITESEPRLRPGMTCRAEIISGEVENALAVPVQAVFREPEGPVVYVRSGAGFDREPVALGAINGVHAQITEGVEAGDKVALSMPEPE